MKKIVTLSRLMLLLFALTCTAFVNAQSNRKCIAESFNKSPDPVKAKETIVRILNAKYISASDTFGKIKYEEAKAFDDRIELTTKKGSKVFYFRDMFYPDNQKKVELVICKEHVPMGNFLKEHDHYDCYIQNTRSIHFDYSYNYFSFSTDNPSSEIRQLAEAFSCFQHELVKACNDSINNDLAQKLKNELTDFQATANAYRQLTVKPVITEEQHKYFVQADALSSEKKFAEAIDLYKKAIEINPVANPATYYNLAFLYSQTNDFRHAIFNMNKYLLLVPDAPDARAAQDKIYEWELKL